MTLPVGITTCAVSVGPLDDFAGDTYVMKVTWQPVLDGKATAGNVRSIVWAATGTPLASFPEKRVSTDGGPITFNAPHVDQPGFIDGTGSAVTGWFYTVTVSARDANRKTYRKTKVFQVIQGQTTVDLDLIPDGTAVVPVTAPLPTVTSVNGQTGAVVVSGGGGAVDSVNGHTGTVVLATTDLADFTSAVTALAGRVLVVDNGDGTVTVTVTGGGFTLVDNGDGTATLTLNGQSVVIGTSGGGWTAVDASTTVKGIVELATNAETTTGTDAVRATTPAGVKAATDASLATSASDATTKANAAQAFAIQRANHTGTQTASTISDFSTAADARITASGAYVPGGTDVPVADGGTGRSTATTAYGLIAAGTTAAGVQQTITPGTSGQFLKSAGASALAGFAGIANTDVSGLGTASTVNTGTTSGTVPLLGASGTLAVARLATGTPDGTKFVRDDGTLATPSGGGGGLDGSYVRTGAFLGFSGNTTISTSATNGYWRPLRITKGGTVTSVKVNVSTAGAAGTLIWLALYAHSATTGLPTGGPIGGGFGSVAGDTTGLKSITISQVLTDNTIYWVYYGPTVGSPIMAAIGNVPDPLLGAASTANGYICGMLDWGSGGLTGPPATPDPRVAAGALPTFPSVIFGA